MRPLQGVVVATALCRRAGGGCEILEAPRRSEAATAPRLCSHGKACPPWWVSPCRWEVAKSRKRLDAARRLQVQALP
jgi:hypothetical protein